MRDPAENAALGFDHGEPDRVEFREVRADAVLGHEAVVTAIVGFANRGVDTHFSRDASHDELADAAILKKEMEFGCPERTFARLVDYGLPRQWSEFWNDVVTGLAANEDSSHRTEIADAWTVAAAFFFRRWQIGKIGAVAFAGVHDDEAVRAPRVKQPADWRDRPAQLRHVVAERFAKAAALEKVALHIDDDQRAFCRNEMKRPWLGGNGYRRWGYGIQAAMWAMGAVQTPACSRARATRSNVDSFHGAPMSCTAHGCAPAVCTGAATTGRPRKVIG